MEGDLKEEVNPFLSEQAILLTKKGEELEEEQRQIREEEDEEERRRREKIEAKKRKKAELMKKKQATMLQQFRGMVEEEKEVERCIYCRESIDLEETYIVSYMNKTNLIAR